jgi:peroxiredoxin
MRFVIAIILAALFALPVFAQKGPRTGSFSPTFAVASLDGNYYDLAAMRGKVVVLTFWSTRCEICRNEIPKLNSLMTKYDQEKVAFLAPSLDNEQKLTPYLRSHPFNFHILPDSFSLLLQYADRDAEGNLDFGFPSYFVIDKSGKLAYRASGWDHTDELAARISQLLAAG